MLDEFESSLAYTTNGDFLFGDYLFKEIDTFDTTFQRIEPVLNENNCLAYPVVNQEQSALSTSCETTITDLNKLDEQTIQSEESVCVRDAIIQTCEFSNISSNSCWLESPRWAARPFSRNSRRSCKNVKCQLFFCDLCGKVYDQHSELQYHQRRHTGEKPFQCSWPGCDKSFSASNVRVRHLRTHTGEKPYVCPFSDCGKQFTYWKDLRLHKYRHTGERPHKCSWPSCSSCFFRKDDLKHHMYTHTGEKPYRCTFPGCNSRFTQKSPLNLHIRKMHPRNENPSNLLPINESTSMTTPNNLFCPPINFTPTTSSCMVIDCDIFPTMVNNLIQNNDISHSISYNRLGNENSNTMNSMPLPSYPTLTESLRCRRQAQVTADKELISNSPNSTNTFPSNLIRDNTFESFTASVHQCDLCNRMFRSRHDRDCHRMTHTGEKPRACNWPNCDYRCITKSKLLRHERKHTGERKFSCNWEDCGKKFATARHLKEHKRTHTGEKPFKCDWPECEKRFSRKDHIKNHRYTHTGERPRKCPIAGCGAAFIQLSPLKKHLQLHKKHGDQVEDIVSWSEKS